MSKPSCAVEEPEGVLFEEPVAERTVCVSSFWPTKGDGLDVWFFPTKGVEAGVTSVDAVEVDVPVEADVSSLPLPTRGEASRHSLAINSQSPGG